MSEHARANRAAWVAALRSGEYEQGQHRLRSDDASFAPRWCCLGVACDLYEQAGGEFVVGPYDPQEHEDQDLPYEVKNWLGLATTTGAFHVDYLDEVNLIQLNDSGWTFKEIAEIIEAEPETMVAS